MSKKQKYRVKDALLKREGVMITVVNGRTVSLRGESGTFTREGSSARPPKEVEYFAASQDDLKTLYEMGSPDVEIVNEEKDKPDVGNFGE